MVSIAKITPIITKGINYARRGAKVYGPVVFGESSEILSNAYKGAVKTKNILSKQFWQQIWNGTKAAGRAAEEYAVKTGGNKAIFKNMWKSFKNLPKALAEGWKTGGASAKAAGKNAFIGSFKGAFKDLGKKLPGIGSVMLLLMYAPNIVKATKEKGIVEGVKETVKSAARLGGFTIGTAIGSAIFPGIGSLVGGLIGEWIVGKVVGKSYSEKAAEKEEQTEQEALAQQSQQQLQQGQGYVPSPTSAFSPTTNPFANPVDQQQLSQYQKALYGNNGMNDDFMAQAFGIQPKLNFQV